MAEQRDALTELVQRQVGQVGDDRRYSVRDFQKRAIDPDTGYQPSTGLIGKIIKGEGYTVTPTLVSALAEGLGIPREVAAAAAHWQVIGYRDAEMRSGAPADLLIRLGRDEADTPLGRAVAEQWDEEQRHS